MATVFDLGAIRSDVSNYAAQFRILIGAGTSSFDGAYSSLSGKPTTLAGFGITDSITAAAASATYEPKITAGSSSQFFLGDKTLAALRNYNTFPSDRADRIRFIGGTVRPTRTGTSVAWAMISDSQHAPIGVSSVSAVNNTLTINFDQTYAKVITWGVCPDEFLSKFGITAGASVGLSSIAINLYASYNRQAIFTHNGTSWAVSGFSSGFINGSLTVSSNITTVTIVDLGLGASSNVYNHCPMVYAGTNNRVLRLVNSGLGANQCRFALVDPTTGNVAAPASGDVVVCYSVNPNYLLNVASAGDTTLEQDIFDTSPTSNIWFFAIMETS